MGDDSREDQLTCGKEKLVRVLFFQNFYKQRLSVQLFLICPVASKSQKMLFYCKITESDGIDNSEGTDVVRNSGVFSSKQCEICHFYVFKSRNFN